MAAYSEGISTRRLYCLKPRGSSEAVQDVESYNLRSRKSLKHVKWPDVPAEATQEITDFDLPD